MTRKEFLSSVGDAILKDRAATHGQPERSFERIAAYWTLHGNGLGILAKGKSFQAHDVCSFMMLLKMARLEANPTNPDNWAGAAGYGGCGVELATNQDHIPFPQAPNAARLTEPDGPTPPEGMTSREFTHNGTRYSVLTPKQWKGTTFLHLARKIHCMPVLHSGLGVLVYFDGDWNVVMTQDGAFRHQKSSDDQTSPTSAKSSEPPRE